MTQQLAWYDWIGLAGTLMVLVGFLLLQAGRLAGNGIAYQLLNLFGAAGILVTLFGTFNPAVFVLELTWVLISAYGIVRTMRSRTP